MPSKLSSNDQSRRAYGYIRVSSNRQLEGESPETQRSYIQEFADSRSSKVVKWYFDEGESAKTANRPELLRMISDAESGKDNIDQIIVYKLTRISRDLTSYITDIKVPLQRCNVSVYSATENIEDTIHGRMVENFLMMFGQMDNEMKSEYTTDNMRSLARQGYWQSPPPLGYRLVKRPNDLGKPRPTLEPDSKAPLVKEVLELYAEGNTTKAELAAIANSMGLSSRNGKPVSQDAINHMLTARVYAGQVCNAFTGNEPYPAQHEALIDITTFNRNQVVMDGPRAQAGIIKVKNNPIYPLKGLLRCPSCQKPMYASSPTSGSGKRSPRYHCSRKECKGGKSVKASVINTAFLDLLKSLTPSEKVLALYREVLIKKNASHLSDTNTKVQKLQRRLNDLNEEHLKVIKKFTLDQLDTRDKDVLMADIADRRETLQSQLDQLQSSQILQRSEIEHAVILMRDVALQWDSIQGETQQRFQNMLFPDGIHYRSENGQFGTTKISPLYGLIRGGEIVSLQADLESNKNGGGYQHGSSSSDEMLGRHSLEAKGQSGSMSQ